MAVVTLLGAPTFNTTAGGSAKTVVATPAVGDLIVIITAHSGYTGSAAPTDNNSSGTYVSAESRLKLTSLDRIEIWIRTALIPAATSTTFTQTTTTTSGGGLAVVKVTGMSRVGSTAKVKSGGQDNQTTGTPAVSWTGGGNANGNNAIIGAVFYDSLSVLMTPPGGFAELTEVNYNTPPAGLEVVSVDNGLTGGTLTWGNAPGVTFASVAVELSIAGPDELSLIARTMGMG